MPYWEPDKNIEYEERLGEGAIAELIKIDHCNINTGTTLLQICTIN